MWTDATDFKHVAMLLYGNKKKRIYIGLEYGMVICGGRLVEFINL